MAQTKTIQRRIRSVKNAGQITKALEVVAASRMRRIQDSVAKVRRYGEVADIIMRKVAGSPEAANHTYFKPGIGKTKLYIIFSSDRGQAGAFNSNLFNLAHHSFLDDRSKGLSPAVIVFGRKGAAHFARISGIELVGSYENIADVPDINIFAPLFETIEDGMDDGGYESVQLIYTEFKSSLLQSVKQAQLLPISVQAQTTEDGKPAEPEKVHEFEPGIEQVLEEAIKIYFEARLMAARVESAASENAMRMIAMGNAHRNASDLVEDLTLALNSVRQAAITQEIAEITGGAAAIAG